jgi:hypothetical protein
MLLATDKTTVPNQNLLKKLLKFAVMKKIKNLIFIIWPIRFL